MIASAIHEVAGSDADFEVEISVRDGEKLAEKTLNGRLGIVGGLSILGTTGIVIPFSCSAWIHSIWRGIDVARAEGLPHLLGATGDTSEKGGASLLRAARDRPDRHGRFHWRYAQILKKPSGSKGNSCGWFVAKMTKLGHRACWTCIPSAGLADLEAAGKTCGRGRCDGRAIGRSPSSQYGGARLSRAEAAGDRSWWYGRGKSLGHSSERTWP